jgi:murein DD-endopeptidase MepM/ murein hydrolase activator NlpD
MFQHRSSGDRRHPVLLAALIAGALITSASPAGAAPPPPPNPSDAQLGAARSEQVAAAAEVGRIAGLVAQAQSDLERVEVAAEAAGAASMAAEDALHRAQDTADRTAADLAAAGAAVTAVQQRIAQLSRNRYMGGSRLAGTAALLDSAGPSELLQRAATLDYVSGNQLRVMAQLQVAKVAQANADAAARQARDTTARARAAAQQAKDDADRAVAAEQVALASTNAQQAAYAQQLQAAQIRLLQLQGARDAYQQWAAAKRAEELAAAAAARRRAGQVAAAAAAARARAAAGSPGYVLPAAGQVSSCFGYRWGALHAGLDLAAPIGTPVYAATSGVVRRAGAATGFGQAVYIEGDDGAVTVYGHVNRYFVSTGERVGAGQQIAEVGNRGQSTGPHLHFEVHPSGAMYSGAIDPVPWLNARGIEVGGCGG